MPYDQLPDVVQYLREMPDRAQATYMGVEIGRFEKEELVKIAGHLSELLGESYSERSEDLKFFGGLKYA